MSVCVIVPSRGRPRQALELAHQFIVTAVCTETTMVFIVDDDDPELPMYTVVSSVDPRVSVVVGPRVRMGPTLNREAVRVAPDYDVVGFMGDDHRPRTSGWDYEVGQALSAAPGVLYGDDLIHGANLPTAVFMTTGIVQRLGYMAPPGLVHLYLDNFWLDLGRATNLTYRPDLVFEHLHPIAGKAEWDAGYIEVNSDATTQRDAAEYQRYVHEDWPTERLKVM